MNPSAFVKGLPPWPGLGFGLMETDSLAGLLALLVPVLSVGTALLSAGVWIRRPPPKSALAAIDDQDVDEAIQEIRESERTQGSDYAPSPGDLEARAIVSVYGKELIAEAQRIAKRANAERPSDKHVRQAADRIGILRDRAGAAADLALAVGSILVGGAIAFQVNLWTGGSAKDGVGLWVVLAFAIGVGLASAAGVIKWRRV